MKSMQKVSFPFAYKLALSMVLLITAGMLLLGGLIIHDQNKLLEKQMHSYAHILIHQLTASSTDGFLTSDALVLDVLVNNISQYPEIQGIAFYSEDQQKRTSKGLIPPSFSFPDDETKISTLSWLPAFADSTTSNNDPRPFFSQHSPSYLTYIGLISYKNITIGYALLTFDQSLLLQARNKTLYTIALTTIILIIISVFFAFFLGKFLSRPIEALVKASHAISKGDYNIHFDDRRNDEFGILMHSLNQMADGLLQKESVEKAFSRYLSPTVAKEILDNLEGIDLGGQQVEASVLFVDIIGFTELSQTMNPEKTNQLLNEYFSLITQAANINGGHVDKFMGDCAMLVFGVPRQDIHHSYQAISCALLIQKIISNLNKQRKAVNKNPINFHIAANSGIMLAGNMGSKQRMEYTVIGDSVNLAARIASHAHNNEVVIPDTMLACKGIKENFKIEKKGRINIRGHKKPITLYRVVSCINKNQINLTRNMDKLLSYDFNEK